jgi:hypothetical protein
MIEDPVTLCQMVLMGSNSVFSSGVIGAPVELQFVAWLSGRFKDVKP